jgi:hypothetical protein
MADKDTEKIAPASNDRTPSPEAIKPDNYELEVFQTTEDGVDFRTVTWPRAAIVFLKILFATGVLSIPAGMYEIGAVGGALVLVGFGCLNTYVGKIQGDFRNKHPSCHSVADMAEVIGGSIFKELVGALYLVAWVLCAGAGINGIAPSSPSISL